MSSPSNSPRENALIPTLFLVGVTALLAFIAIPRPYRDGALPTAVPTTAPTSVVVADAAAAQPTTEDHLTLMAFGLEEVPASSVQNGSRLFSTTCTACHGSDARGILGLGKPLIDSAFVNKLNDEEMVAFLHVGRSTSNPENTTKVAMPAKGGNPSLTDDDLNAIVDYIRSLNGATVVQDAVAEATPFPTARPFQTIDISGIPTTGNTNASPVTTEGQDATPTVSAPTDATPVTSYGYETQGQATEAPAIDATPTTSYGYNTQSQSTAEAPVSSSAGATPTTGYSYQTQSEAVNPPVSYGYEAQADATTQP